MGVVIGILAALLVAGPLLYLVIRLYNKNRLGTAGATIGALLAVFLGVASFAGGFIGYDWAVLRSQYVQVTGRVVEVEQVCAFERERSGRRSSGTTQGDPMPCNEAEAARAAGQHEDARLVRLRRLHYSYTSPVDGGSYRGSVVVQPAFQPVNPGDPIPIAAHTSNAAQSRYDRY